ncbi:MAG: LapA family protein [Candidatus Paceibacterota bacterium]
MTFISLILGFVLGAGAIVFALQNNAIVSLTFLQWHFDSSLALVIILATAVGVLLGVLASIPSIIRRSFTIMNLKKQNRGLYDETETIRKMNEDTKARLNAEIAAEPPATIDLRS